MVLFKRFIVLFSLCLALLLFSGCFQMTPRVKMDKSFKVETELTGASSCQNTACMCQIEETRFRYVMWFCSETPSSVEGSAPFPAMDYNSTAGDSCEFIGDQSGAPQGACYEYDINFRGEEDDPGGAFKAWNCDDCCWFSPGRTGYQVVPVMCNDENPTCRIDVVNGDDKGCDCSMTDGFEKCGERLTCKSAMCQFLDSKGNLYDDFCYRASGDKPAVGATAAAIVSASESPYKYIYDFWGSCEGGRGMNRKDCEEDGGEWEKKDFADADGAQAGPDQCVAKCVRGSHIAAWSCFRNATGEHNLHMTCETKVLRTLQGGNMFKVVPCDAAAMKSIMENPLLEIATFKIGQGPDLFSFEKARAACEPSLEIEKRVSLGLKTFNPEEIRLPGFASVCFNNKDDEEHALEDELEGGEDSEIEVGVGECAEKVKLEQGSHVVTDEKTTETLEAEVGESGARFGVGDNSVTPANAQADYNGVIIFEGLKGRMTMPETIRIDRPLGEDIIFDLLAEDVETFNRRLSRDEFAWGFSLPEEETLHPGLHMIYYEDEDAATRSEQFVPAAQLFIYSASEVWIKEGTFSCPVIDGVEVNNKKICVDGKPQLAIGSGEGVKIKNDDDVERTVNIYRRVEGSLETVEEKKMLPKTECVWKPPESGTYYLALGRVLETLPGEAVEGGREAGEGSGVGGCLPGDLSCAGRGRGSGSEECAPDDFACLFGVGGGSDDGQEPDAFLFVSSSSNVYNVDIEDAAFSPNYLTMLDEESMCFVNPTDVERQVKIVGYSMPGQEFVDDLGVEKCSDRKDNDLDGYVDCEDTECAGSEGCGGFLRVPVGEVCNNLRDDDFDGRVDCNDADCRRSPLCDITEKRLEEEVGWLSDEDATITIPANHMSCDCLSGAEQCFIPKNLPRGRQTGIFKFRDLRNNEELVVGVSSGKTFFVNMTLLGFTPSSSSVASQGKSEVCFTNFDSEHETRVVQYEGYFDSDGEMHAFRSASMSVPYGEERCREKSNYAPGLHVFKDVTSPDFPMTAYVLAGEEGVDGVGNKYVFLTENEVIPSRLEMAIDDNLFIVNTVDGRIALNNGTVLSRPLDPFGVTDSAFDVGRRTENVQLRNGPSGQLVFNGRGRMNWTGWSIGIKTVSDARAEKSFTLSIMDSAFAAKIPKVGPGGYDEDARLNLATVWTAGPPSILTLRKLRALINERAIPAIVLSFSGDIQLSVIDMNRRERFQVRAGSKVELMNIDDQEHVVKFDKYHASPLTVCGPKPWCAENMPEAYDESKACGSEGNVPPEMDCAATEATCKDIWPEWAGEENSDYLNCLKELGHDECVEDRTAWCACMAKKYFGPDDDGDEGWKTCADRVETNVEEVNALVGVPQRDGATKIFDATNIALDQYEGENVSCASGGSDADCGVTPSPNWHRVTTTDASVDGSILFSSEFLSNAKDGVYYLSDYPASCFEYEEGEQPEAGSLKPECDVDSMRNSFEIEVVNMDHKVSFDLTKISQPSFTGNEVCFENVGKILRNFSVKQFFGRARVKNENYEFVLVPWAMADETYTTYWDENKLDASGNIGNHDPTTSSVFCSLNRFDNPLLNIFIGERVEDLQPIVDIKNGEFSAYIKGAGEGESIGIEELRLAPPNMIKIANKADGPHKIEVNGVPFALLAEADEIGLRMGAVYAREGDERLPVITKGLHALWDPENSRVQFPIEGWKETSPDIWSASGKYIFKDVRDDEKCDGAFSAENANYQEELEMRGVCGGSTGIACETIETCPTKLFAKASCPAMCPEASMCEYPIEGGYTAEFVDDIRLNDYFCGVDPDKVPKNYAPKYYNRATGRSEGIENPEKQSMYAWLEAKLGPDPNGIDAEATEVLEETCSEVMNELRDAPRYGGCGLQPCDPDNPPPECSADACGSQPVDPMRGECEAYARGESVSVETLANIDTLCEGYFEEREVYETCRAINIDCVSVRAAWQQCVNGFGVNDDLSLGTNYVDWLACKNAWEAGAREYNGQIGEHYEFVPGMIEKYSEEGWPWPELESWTPEWLDGREPLNIDADCSGRYVCASENGEYDGKTRPLAMTACEKKVKTEWDRRAWQITQDWYTKHMEENRDWFNCMDICTNCKADCANDYSDEKFREEFGVGDADISDAKMDENNLRCDYVTGVCDAFTTFSTPSFGDSETYPNYVFVKDATYSRGLTIEVYNGEFENGDVVGGPPKTSEGTPDVRLLTTISKHTGFRDQRDYIAPRTEEINAPLSGGTGEGLKNPFTVRVVFSGEPRNPASFYGAKVNFEVSYSRFEGAMDVEKEIFFGKYIDVNNPGYSGSEGTTLMLDAGPREDGVNIADSEVYFTNGACDLSEEDRERMKLECSSDALNTQVIVQSNWNDDGLKNIAPGGRGCFTAEGGRAYHVYDDNIEYPVTGEDVDLQYYLGMRDAPGFDLKDDSFDLTSDADGNCIEVDDHAGFVLQSSPGTTETGLVKVANFSYRVDPRVIGDPYRGDRKRTVLQTSPGSRVCFKANSVEGMSQVGTVFSGVSDTHLIVPPVEACEGVIMLDLEYESDEGGVYIQCPDQAKKYIWTNSPPGSYEGYDAGSAAAGMVGDGWCAPSEGCAWNNEERRGDSTSEWVYGLDAGEETCWYPPANDERTVPKYVVADPYSGTSFDIISAGDSISIPLVLEQFEPTTEIYARSGAKICVLNEDGERDKHVLSFYTACAERDDGKRPLPEDCTENSRVGGTGDVYSGEKVCFEARDYGTEYDYLIQDDLSGKIVRIKVTDECSIYGEETAVIAKRMSDYDHAVFDRPEFNIGPEFNEHGPATPAIITTEVGGRVSDACMLAQLRSIKENCRNCSAAAVFLEPFMESPETYAASLEGDLGMSESERTEAVRDYTAKYGGSFVAKYNQLINANEGNGLFAYVHDDPRVERDASKCDLSDSENKVWCSPNQYKGTPITDMIGVFALFKNKETCDAKELLNEVKKKANYSLQEFNSPPPGWEGETDVHGDPVKGSYTPMYVDKKDYKKEDFKSGKLPAYIGYKEMSIPTIVLGYGFTSGSEWTTKMCTGGDCMSYQSCSLSEAEMAQAFKDFFTKETYSLASHGVIGVAMHCYEDGRCQPFNIGLEQGSVEESNPWWVDFLEGIGFVYGGIGEPTPYGLTDKNGNVKSPAFETWYDKCGRYFVSASGLVKTTAAAEKTSASICDPGRIMALYDQYKCTA
ncbi:hypothetical protein HY992_01895 [Candidatus Micrarchaeota archaeon]|nr:hypothetical protein [Candidatus Micrarchaeota archaeon]